MIIAQITNSPAWWRWLSDSKDAFSSVESVFKILAIIVGAWWAWLVFLRKRERYPRAKLTHEVQFWDVQHNHRLVRVTLTIANVSDVLLPIHEGHTWIQQMRPWPTEILKKATSAKSIAEEEDPELLWPLIKEKKLNGEREIEPQESDQLVMDFVIEKFYEKILVYSWVENCRKPGRNIGWNNSTVVDLTVEKEIAPGIKFIGRNQPHQATAEGPDVDFRQSQDKIKPGDAEPPPHGKKGTE